MKEDFRYYLAGALSSSNKHDPKDVVIQIPEPWRVETDLLRKGASGLAALQWDVVVLGEFAGGVSMAIDVSMENLDWARYFILSESDRDHGSVIASDEWSYDEDNGLTYADKKDSSSSSCILC